MIDLFPGREALRYVTCVLFLLLTPAIAAAQELLVHLPFDGSIENAGSGGTAELAGPAPTTVQGHIGGAMKFDGQVVAVPVDLSPNQVSRVTVTAWVKADANAPDTSHWIVSSGTQGTTPFLRLLKRRQGLKTEIRGGRASLLSGDFSPAEQWVFVAGTVDIPAQQLRMQQDDTGYLRNGIRTDSLYDASTHINPNDSDADPQAWVFIGARSFNTNLGAAAGVAMDDVRVYADALSSAQLADLKNGGGQTIADAGIDLPGQPGGDITMPERQSPTDDILAERQGAGIQQIDPPDGIGSGSGTGSDQSPLTTSRPEERQLPDTEEIEQQVTDLAREEAEARAAEREAAARQQALRAAEEERLRQEQEEAEEEEQEPVRGEGRIGVGTLTVEAGEIPEGVRNFQIDSDEEHRTTVSGGGWGVIAGQLRVDLRRYAIHTIAWYEEGDRPCEVVITAYAPGANRYEGVSGRAEACNGDGGNNRSRQVVTLQPSGGVITSLRVCIRGPVVTPGLITIPPDGRMKGLDITGRYVSADGTLEGAPFPSDSAHRPNCDVDEIQDTVACPTGHVATGLVNHLKQTSRDNYFISGIQLICRSVEG